MSLEDILMFATGLKEIPAAKLIPQPQLTFQKHSRFPEANVCANTIKLPILPSYEIFEEAMNYGIKNAPGFGLHWGVNQKLTFVANLHYCCYCLHCTLLFVLLHCLQKSNFFYKKSCTFLYLETFCGRFALLLLFALYCLSVLSQFKEIKSFI